MVKGTRAWAVLFGIAMVVCGTRSSGIQAQATLHPDSFLGPFVEQATLTRRDGRTDADFGRRVALGGNIALAAVIGQVYVFERTPGTDSWAEVAPIVPPNETVSEFGRSLAFDGRTAIIAAENVAYLYRRNNRGVWRLIATLTPPDKRLRFAVDVGIDGDLAIVGATGTVAQPGNFIPGAAYIFQRNASGAWDEIARLEPTTTTALARFFGARVAIGKTAAVVSEVADRGSSYIFRREHDSWPLVRRVGGGGLRSTPSVAVDNDTALFAGGPGGDFTSLSLIFGRNQGGPNEWGPEANFPSAGLGPGTCCGPLGSSSVSGNSIILGFTDLVNGANILSRNQGGPNAWGRAAFLRDPRGTGILDGQLGSGVAISGDTAIVGSPDFVAEDHIPEESKILVLVSDIDGDGVRDGIDPCPRDPLNRTDKHCRRDTSSLPIVDHLITSSEFTTTFVTPRRAEITATFTNTDSVAIRNPFFAVTEITDGAVLLNGDGLDRGVSATLSPDVGDGTLSPGESTFVMFRVRLQTRGPIEFRVALHGEVTP